MPDDPGVQPVFVDALVDALEHDRLFGLNGVIICADRSFCAG